MIPLLLLLTAVTISYANTPPSQPLELMSCQIAFTKQLSNSSQAKNFTSNPAERCVPLGNYACNLISLFFIISCSTNFREEHLKAWGKWSIARI